MFFFCYIQSHNLDKVPEALQNWNGTLSTLNRSQTPRMNLRGRSMSRFLLCQNFGFEITQMSGLCLITNVGFPPPPSLKHRTTKPTCTAEHPIVGRQKVVRFDSPHEKCRTAESLVLPLEGKCTLAISNCLSELFR